MDVIVIGAGAAGPAAARRLRERGAQVLVLEARDRVDLAGSDRSADEFLESVKMGEAHDARMLIEGFDAAITADAGIIAIAKEWRSNARRTGRMVARGGRRGGGLASGYRAADAVLGLDVNIRVL